jgi:hypothetical protein
MTLSPRLRIVVKALRQLGVEQVGLFAIYQLGLQTGHYRRQLNSTLTKLNIFNIGSYLDLKPCLPGLPNRSTILDLVGDQIGQLFEQADEIVSGKVRLFGGQPVPLVLDPPQPLAEWVKYERGGSQVSVGDIKILWEPGRFGWACTLAMAYQLSEDKRYADTFWLNTERFITYNPPYYGPHWSSAQEVAIRLVALAFALQVFAQSGQVSQDNLELVAKLITYHAERIPPTLVYARSQNNNHLITEALGLYTASALLPKHPLAIKWHKLGWYWLKYAFLTQIDPDGTYTQHSTNYHRLMLQAALWAFAIHNHLFLNEQIPAVITDRLKASTHWLNKLLDPDTGHVPNLGHNDGAYILPLTICPQQDYRPVIYAADQAFLNLNLLPEGSWSDMSHWLSLSSIYSQGHGNVDSNQENQSSPGIFQLSPFVLKDQKNGSWISLRVAKFHSRPAHADQLHLDLWWHGLNLAQDPGTYLYNAAPPWDNSLTSAFVHNTVTIDEKEFMLRSGRFLYLDWAQAEFVGGSIKSGKFNTSIIAKHDGYRDIGVLHKRMVNLPENGRWKVIDLLEGPSVNLHSARLQWLLPDWEYDIHVYPESSESAIYDIQIRSPFGWVTLKLGLLEPKDKLKQKQNYNFQLVRAGNLIYGTGSSSPISGWVSPTYGAKVPALSCILEVTQSLPIELLSEWILPSES